MCNQLKSHSLRDKDGVVKSGDLVLTEKRKGKTKGMYVDYYLKLSKTVMNAKIVKSWIKYTENKEIIEEFVTPK